MRLYLDDIRNPHTPDWTVVRTAPEALTYILRCDVEIASLDHDLADDPWTGYWLLCQVEELVAAGAKIPTDFVIHSANPVGRKNMQAAIDSINRMRDA